MDQAGFLCPPLWILKGCVYLAPMVMLQSEMSLKRLLEIAKIGKTMLTLYITPLYTMQIY
jgi:hypothetical protein